MTKLVIGLAVVVVVVLIIVILATRNMRAGGREDVAERSRGRGPGERGWRDDDRHSRSVRHPARMAAPAPAMTGHDGRPAAAPTAGTAISAGPVPLVTPWAATASRATDRSPMLLAAAGPAAGTALGPGKAA